MARLYGCLVALAALTACGTSAGSFPEDYGRVLCDRQKECYPTEFDAEYDNEGECREEADALFVLFDFDECDFDRAEANDCLGELRSRSCEELENDDAFDACARVYTNCPEEQFDTSS